RWPRDWSSDVCSSDLIISHTVIPSSDRFARVSIIPHDPEAFARAIYAALHECDDAGAELIVVEDLPDSAEWRAIGDRLKRAAARSEERRVGKEGRGRW